MLKLNDSRTIIFPFENYLNFKDIINEKIREISNFTKTEYEKELSEILKSENKNDLLIEYYFFINYKTFLNSNFSDIINKIHNNHELFFEELKNYKIYDKNQICNYNYNIYKIIFHMFLYFIIKQEKNIHLIINNSDDKYIKEINESYNIIFQLFFIILKLYYENIYSLKQLLLFSDTIFYFIKNNIDFNDKFIKLKNMFFLELFFVFISKILIIILKNNKTKEDVLYFFNYLMKFLESNELKSNFNRSILINNQIIQQFISLLLSNYDFNNSFYEDIFKLFQPRLIQNLAKLYEQNFNHIFFEILINQNKNSFANLFNYMLNKEKIINDIYIKNFYVELLNKSFENERNINNNNYIPPKDSFIFNGFNSKMAFRLSEFKLNDFIVIFSFKIINNTNNQNCIFPIFCLENASTNENIFKLYIKQKEDKEKNIFINKLYISSLDKKNDILLDKIDNISPNTNYYMALYFNNKKLSINGISLDKFKEKNFQQQIEISNYKQSIINIRIGHNNNEKEYFKGYIGSFIIIQNLSLKNNNYDQVINNIFKLKDFYKYFPYFIRQKVSYDFSQILNIDNLENENLFYEIREYLKNNINEFECIFYLTPELLNIYYSLFDKYLPFAYLPEVPDICESQKDYHIHEMNISLTNFFPINLEFIKNNGFDYLCLIYEYFYQFANLYLLNQKEFNFESIEPKLKLLFSNIINKTILILQNYNKCKYVLYFHSSLKKLFKNFYECLKILNNIWNVINGDIITNLYELFFKYKDDSLLLQEENNMENLDLKEKIIPFCDGLIDLLFDIDLYKKNNDCDSIEILFLFTSSFLSNYIKSLRETKIAPFKPDFFWKIINFTYILENLFTIDYKNKNKAISSFFGLLENFFISIKNQSNCSLYFKNLLQFFTSHFQNQLTITYNFLYFMHEMLWKGYNFDNEDILLLLNYAEQYYDENADKNNKKIINELFSVVSCIFVEILFNKDSSNVLNDVYQKIKIFSNNEVIIFNITNEIRRIIEGLIINNNQNDNDKVELKCYKDNISNYMNFYWNIFKFIITLFKNLIIVENEINSENEENKVYKIKSQVSYCHIYSLLVNIEEIIRYNRKTKNKINKHSFYCLINFIKFYHYIIFNEKEIMQFMGKAFVDNIFQVIIDNSKKFHLINFNQLFTVTVNNCEYKKTIIEIIFEIYLQYFLNNCNSKDCYKIFITFYNIFYDNEIEKNQKYSIFYVNDYLRYIFTNKKGIVINENCFLQKYKILNTIYNEINFNKEIKFDCNFTTFFLLRIGKYQQIFKNSDNYKNTFIPELNKILSKLYNIILEEHLKLAELKKGYFFKTSSAQNNDYNELIKLLKNKYIKKKNNQEINKFFEINMKELSGKQIKNIISDLLINNSKENEKEKIIKKNTLKLNEAKVSDNCENNDKSEEIKNKYIKNEPFSLEEKINKINYFNEFDKYYLKNPKKEIMNNIFVLYYLDVFFYNEYFCKMKKYFLNKYFSNNISNTKQLDFPSKLKNFSNNLDPPLFIKQYNDYFNGPIFPITHSYIQKENKKIIENYKSIKLFPKKLSIIKSEDENIFECELIKHDNYFYGNIIIKSDYMIFNEKEINLNDYEKGYKYLFLLSYFFENEQKKSFYSKKDELNKKRIIKKTVLIIFNEIEEIVERRALLMWKAVEIYLKNGKSHIFNFLNCSEYENFLKIIKNSSTIKNLIRKKDFLKSEKKITNEWKKGHINNYEYILLLNKYSSRTYNDTMQYPVFPWLLKNYENLQAINENKNKFEEALIEYLNFKADKENLYEIKNKNNNINASQNSSKINEAKLYIRKLEYPPSLQTKEKRETTIMKYIDAEGYESFQSHSGCHYSTSAYIFFYLMRQQPYCNSLVKLQGYHLENTNRCFLSISTVEMIIENGNDNRELIPEFFSKIEGFLNLNCDFYGFSEHKRIVDDVLFDNFKTYQIEKKYIINKYPLTINCHFIIEHKKLLNSKIIGNDINKWIDCIFGINQLPLDKEKRKNSCNIYPKYSYEQLVNLENKLNKKIKKNVEEKEIKQNLNLKINQIVNFGQVPYQIFQEAHPILNLTKKEEINENEENKLNKQDVVNESVEEDMDDFESLINKTMKEENLDNIIDGIPIYFQINPLINKIFIYNLKGDIKIINCELFNRIDCEFYNLSNYYNLQNTNIFIYGITHDKYQYLIYKLKYAFNSFNIEKGTDIFHTYSTQIISEINKKTIQIISNTDKNKNDSQIMKINKKNDKKKYDNFKFITCRHIDHSFKIYLFKKIYKKEKTKKNEVIFKMFSFVCEDFVTACCAVSSNHFIIGLKNGKLILYSIDLIEESNNDKNKKNKDNINKEIKIKLNKIRYIKGHKGKINVIEIDKRIGVIITSGDDNYLFIRKLYDFELLLPIKIKDKYIILMAKISSYNFLYILCYNNKNNQTVIFGYTLSGLKFAKSEYGLFDNISFTGNGNIVTMNKKEEVIVLSGSDLTRINIIQDEETIKAINKINGTSWMQFDCFLREFDEDITKILTFFIKENNNQKLLTLNANNFQYFD